jgi:hypothetical protein
MKCRDIRYSGLGIRYFTVFFFFYFNELYKFKTLLNLRPLIFALTPFGWFYFHFGDIWINAHIFRKTTGA